MTRYYISDITAKRGFIELSEQEWFDCFGSDEIRWFANEVYNGTLPTDDVPEEMREAVQTVVNNRIARFGLYEDLKIHDGETLRIVTGIDGLVSRKEARALRSVVETAAVSLDDQTASTAATLFPALRQDGSLVKAGTRVNWNGTIKRAAVDLWDTSENDPDNAPTLWEDIAYRQGYRIIPAVITAGAAFAKGERGWWGDALYESLIDANVYTPEQYADGWRVVE